MTQSKNIKIIGIIFLIIATIITTTISYPIDNKISNIESEISESQNKIQDYLYIISKQEKNSILEELYALQSNDMFYLGELEKSDKFGEKVLELSSQSAIQWAAAIIYEDGTITEEKTKLAIKQIRNLNIDSVIKRDLLDLLGNKNLEIANASFEELRREIIEKEKNVINLKSKKRLFYILFVIAQISGLILIGLLDINDTRKK